MTERRMNFHEVADIIGRFLGDKIQDLEWDDFIHTKQDDWVVDAYRKCCFELDPLISHLGEPYPGVVAVLQAISKTLREIDMSKIPVDEKKPGKDQK